MCIRDRVNTESGKETFTVVGEWEADPKESKISHESPLGKACLLYTSPSPRDRTRSRMPSSA